MSMAALSIVENLDVIEHVAACFFATAIHPATYALLLQAAEEGLGDGMDAPMSSNGS